MIMDWHAVAFAYCRSLGVHYTKAGFTDLDLFLEAVDS